MVTLSVIKADTGGFVGHSAVHPDMMGTAEAALKERKDKGLIKDFRVGRVGVDVGRPLPLRPGVDSELLHGIAWEVCHATTEGARGLKLYGGGQDLLKGAFAGPVKGLGPGVAEREY